MVNKYKFKPEKHKYTKSHDTIDEAHKKKLKSFQKSRNDIPNKQKKIDKLKKKLKSITNENNNNKFKVSINDIKNKIDTLQKEINNSQSHKNELEYFSKVGDIVYDFYNITNGKIYNNLYP